VRRDPEVAQSEAIVRASGASGLHDVSATACQPRGINVYGTLDRAASWISRMPSGTVRNLSATSLAVSCVTLLT
jgi:hypothetical protein